MHELPTQEFIEKCFWWLVGIFGSLLTTGLVALIGVLWSMNGSIVSLDDKVGGIAMRQVHQEGRTARADEKIYDHDLRLATLEAQRDQRKKPQR